MIDGYLIALGIKLQEMGKKYENKGRGIKLVEEKNDE